ncbi:T9SS sorting signal type C domain-containing protein [Flavobacterium sp. GT3R68]|uniref:T9SS sorting signal type C domain-containing protein n=1 Tax=Flavobacterium sp. GT3R68 TaxID=2594437 RepID=UPI000F87483A|nr:T9SS sorting signal type C domain-containing protein [Flavobacterium sp. GT3R68]RTY90875.1 T9SS sorting signal type C domain-containing protein [Flavobacterium sp. GSN2]TRW93867.1 T9SS sorting signal type C domain-containing protein [Flavobacterium sp. GT3R68]
MNKTLHTSKNKAVSISLLLLVLGSLNAFSQTNTFTGTVNSNWNTAMNWSLLAVPTAIHDLVIPSGKSVIVNADASAKTISLSGNLTMNSGIKLTVNGNLTVNATGNFTMPGGSGLATLVVYGNFMNNGLTDFWKSTVVILGDLISPLTSSLQNQGNIVVGGNIIGSFAITGGSGAGQIYALNPNATVTITPASIDNNVTPGTPLSGSESNALIDLVNQVIYGASCPFAISDVANVTICSGNIAVFTVSTTGTLPTYQWQVNSGSGWLDLANDAVYAGVSTPTMTIANASITMDGYRYRASITAASCTKNGNYGKLIFTVAPTAPIVGAITQPACVVSTGSVVLSGLPASGIVNPGNITYVGTSCTINNLNPGTYSFIASNTTCASPASANVVINPILTTIWNGSSWSNGAPAADKNVIFSANYSSSANFDACSCSVNSGVNVTVNSGHTLTVSNAITATSGSLIFENNASLIQSGYTGINTGIIIAKRNSAPVILSDYTYWSSPTSGSQTLLNFSPNTAASNFFTYHNAWTYSAPATDTFTKGLGYAIIAPIGTSTTVPASLAQQFTGVPNNGNIDVTVALGPNPISNRLIGNPYPSAIDADAFINANVIGTGSINKTISGTLYFWTHNHSLSGNNYLSSDYATYNLSGGTAVASGTGNTGAPIRYIPSGQGFFVHTVANGNVSFTNTMRTGTSNTNFYKTSNSITAVPTLESHRMWLNLTNSTSSFSQILLGYIETATDDANPGLDGLYYGADQHVLYSFIGTEAYTIQAKALPFANSDVVPLGYKINVAGATTISLDHLDGVFAGNQNIYLDDQLLNVTHDLKAAPYTFTSQAGTFNNRFVVRYTTETLGNGGFDLHNKVTVATGKNQIIIKSESTAIDQVILFDVLGRKIHENKKINNNEFQISGLLTHQTVIAQIILADGQVIAKKLVY